MLYEIEYSYINGKNPMESFKIIDILEKIRDRYAHICEMTETFNIASGVDTCIGLVRKRASLLSEIEDEQNYLEQYYPGWQKECLQNKKLMEIINEIQSSIEVLIVLDNIIKDKFRQRMNLVKAEIGNLSSYSKVALSYERNKVYAE